MVPITGGTLDTTHTEKNTPGDDIFQGYKISLVSPVGAFFRCYIGT